MHSQVKRPFQVLLFSTPLSLFIAGFLSSIANASRTFLSFIPLALSITRTLCQSMSCDPFPFKDMLSDGRFLLMTEPNCIPMFLRSYFQSSHRLPHVLVLTGLAFYWIHNIPLCSTRQSLLYIVQAIEGLGLVERASDSSFEAEIPGQFVWLHSSLPQWTECELPAILPCWSLHLLRTAGAPKLSSTALSVLSQWTSSDSHFLTFHPRCARFPPSLIFRHCKPWLLWLLCQQTLEQFHVWPTLGDDYQRRGIDPCVLAFCTLLCPIYLPRLLWTVRPWTA